MQDQKKFPWIKILAGLGLVLGFLLIQFLLAWIVFGQTRMVETAKVLLSSQKTSVRNPDVISVGTEIIQEVNQTALLEVRKELEKIQTLWAELSENDQRKKLLVYNKNIWLEPEKNLSLEDIANRQKEIRQMLKDVKAENFNMWCNEIYGDKAVHEISFLQRSRLAEKSIGLDSLQQCRIVGNFPLELQTDFIQKLSDKFNVSETMEATYSNRQNLGNILGQVELYYVERLRLLDLTMRTNDLQQIKNITNELNQNQNNLQNNWFNYESSLSQVKKPQTTINFLWFDEKLVKKNKQPVLDELDSKDRAVKSRPALTDVY
jgi:hypothetical protein